MAGCFQLPGGDDNPMSDMPPSLLDKVPDRLPAEQASRLCYQMVHLLSLDYHFSPSGSFSNKSFCSNGILAMVHPLSSGSTLKAWPKHPDDDDRYTDQVDESAHVTPARA